MFVLVEDNLNIYAISSGDFISSTTIEDISSFDVGSEGIIIVGTATGSIQMWDLEMDKPRLFQVLKFVALSNDKSLIGHGSSVSTIHYERNQLTSISGN